MCSRLTRRLALALLMACTGAATQAEDIDLFVGASASATTEVPNVLIVLDNTANWNTAFTNEIAALAATINGLPADKFRVGLMMFTESGSGNSNADGGYVRAAIRLLDSANKTKYQNLVNSLHVLNDKSNGGKLGKTMVEVHRYFSAGTPYAGNNKVKTDYTGNTSGSTASNAIYALTGNALTAKAGTTYTSPIASGCAKNYVIYISNGAVQDNASDTSAATNELSTAGGSTTAIPISPSGSQDNVGDEWARFLKQSSLGVTTYTVDVDKVTTGQGPGWSALLKSMASVSSGKYFDVSSSTGGGAQISTALNKIFSEIQAVNTVFASVSLPVSVNTQGTYLNQVYIGMFRPDQDALPRWMGNLKQYKLGLTSGELNLQDADSTGAINNQTGFIAECARSYWTPTTTDTYWSFRPQGSCLAVTGAANSNYPDGNVVEKGAQAYKLRATTTRTVKTCGASSCTALTDFNNTNVSQAALGAASTTERDALINWAKGQDVDDENLDGTTTAAMRASAHGDVVHSRPVAINYGTDASPQVVVFYGGNDGVLRAINGNRSANIGSVTPGTELWSFIPPEFYGQIKRLRDNSTQVSFYGSTGGSPKPYGMDGPMAVYKDASTAWLYATQRRGGRNLYAFDVSTAASPSLKWRLGCPSLSSDTGCSTGFTGLGQTWSPPKAIKASGYGSGASPILLMGGGYDTCEDADPHTCTSSAKGRVIYALNADTGAVLASFTTERSVVADLTVLTDSSGLATYAYAADLGGNVYRLNIGAAAPAAWTLTKVAALGCADTSACTGNRKFMFAPDVVVEGSNHIVLIGSGDREKPLLGYTTAAGVSNRMYMFKDVPTDAAWLSSESATCGSAVICQDSLLPITTSTNPSASDLAAKKGWYLGLAATEQVVTSSITTYGITTFSTHTPAVPVSGMCGSNLGTARVYNIRYTNAEPANNTASRSETIVGGGLPPSPVGGMVTLDNGTTVGFVIGANPNSPIEAKLRTPLSSAVSQPKSRVYWFQQR